MKIFLVLLYLWAGDVKLEKVQTKNMEACIEMGNARAEALIKNPLFQAGLFADCVMVESREV